MQALLTFPNVEFKQDSADSVRVKQNEEFTITLIGDETIRSVYADQDQVLEHRSLGDGKHSIKALRAGVSEFQVQDNERNAFFYLTFEVHNPAEAATFSVPPPSTEDMN